MKQIDRKFGILIHPTSFPSPFGIGDLGEEAREILKKLAESGVRLWQILPLGPTGYGDSPYSSRSCFAGNEYMIDLRTLPGLDLNFQDFCQDHSQRVNYNTVFEKKLPLLKKAADLFLEKNNKDSDFKNFCDNNSWWLDDYSLYQALVNHFKDSRWQTWENDLKMRNPKAIEHWSNELKSDISRYKVLQYFFYTQWDSLHKFANNLGIEIIGDIPIFAAGDSVDVWSHPELFKLDKNLNQTCGAGVPPDAFCSDGQYWGNPVYNWEKHEQDDFAWWKKRIEHTLSLVDIVRIDHFRGFESYWEVPASSPTAASGKWVKGPGMKLLKNFKDSSIIAEDLGVITPQVEKMLSDSGFPGMKVLQFAFDMRNGYPDKSNYYMPFNITSNCIFYTGTHDNQTTRGWFNEKSPEFKDMLRRFFQCPDEEIVWQMIRCVIASPAKYAVIPMQDLMGLDDDARMNKPSTVGTFNWSWRMNPRNLDFWGLERLKELIKLHGRI